MGVEGAFWTPVLWAGPGAAGVAAWPDGAGVDGFAVEGAAALGFEVVSECAESNGEAVETYFGDHADDMVCWLYVVRADLGGVVEYFACESSV